MGPSVAERRTRCPNAAFVRCSGRLPDVGGVSGRLHRAPDLEAGERGRHGGREGLGHVVTSNRCVCCFEVDASYGPRRERVKGISHLRRSSLTSHFPGPARNSSTCQRRSAITVEMLSDSSISPRPDMSSEIASRVRTTSSSLTAMGLLSRGREPSFGFRWVDGPCFMVFIPVSSTSMPDERSPVSRGFPSPARIPSRQAMTGETERKA